MSAVVSAFDVAGANKTEAARALGLTRASFRRRFDAAVKDGLIIDPPTPPSGMSPVGSAIYTKTEGGARWDRYKAGEPSFDDITERLESALSNYKGKSKLLPPPKRTDADLATVYVCADWHVGLLCYPRETGGEAWDKSIATRVIGGAMNRLISRTENSKIGVILGLGDLLHFDGFDPVTRKSRNVLDADGRHGAVLETATSLIILSVDLALRKHTEIIVRLLPGNHDEISAFAASLAIKMYYANNPKVTVEVTENRFWWWSHGSTFLGATHGDQAKMNDLPLIMAAREPEKWGQSKYRAIYTGHIHTEKAVDRGGVRVRSFQAPIPHDGWHAGMGYGAGRSITAITHSLTRGQRSETTENISEDTE